MIGLVIYFVGGSLHCAANNNSARSTHAYVALSPEMQKWLVDSMRPQARHRYAMSCVTGESAKVLPDLRNQIVACREWIRACQTILRDQQIAGADVVEVQQNLNACERKLLELEQESARSRRLNLPQ